MPWIAALVGSENVRAGLVRAAGRECHVHFCSDGQELAVVAAAQDPGLRALLIEYQPPLFQRLEPALQALRTQSRQLPLLLYGRVSVPWARDMLALASLGLDVRPVLEGFEDVSGPLRLVHGATVQPAPDGLILQRIGVAVAVPAHELVVSAVVVGRRRLGVEEFARRCGLALRTIEGRLHRYKLPRAFRLLGWSTSLHGVWHLDVLGWPVKLAAAEMGFSSSAAFSGYVVRHTGATPSELRQGGGFPELLERFTATLLGREFQG